MDVARHEEPRTGLRSKIFHLEANQPAKRRAFRVMWVLADFDSTLNWRLHYWSMKGMVVPATASPCPVALGVYQSKVSCADSAWGLRTTFTYTTHSMRLGSGLCASWPTWLSFNTLCIYFLDLRPVLERSRREESIERAFA